MFKFLENAWLSPSAWLKSATRHRAATNAVCPAPALPRSAVAGGNVLLPHAARQIRAPGASGRGVGVGMSGGCTVRNTKRRLGPGV